MPVTTETLEFNPSAFAGRIWLEAEGDEQLARDLAYDEVERNPAAQVVLWHLHVDRLLEQARISKRAQAIHNRHSQTQEDAPTTTARQQALAQATKAAEQTVQVITGELMHYPMRDKTVMHQQTRASLQRSARAGMRYTETNAIRSYWQYLISQVLPQATLEDVGQLLKEEMLVQKYDRSEQDTRVTYDGKRMEELEWDEGEVQGSPGE